MMDHDELATVPRLEELAMNASYKEICSNLILCYEHLPKGQKLPWLPFSSVLSTVQFLKSPEMCAIVRSRLDHYLAGIMGDKIRKKYVEKFHQSVSDYSWPTDHPDSSSDDEDKKGSQGDCIIDIWVLLDCVLDGSFEELETHIAYPGCEPNPKLIPTIAKHSPRLKKLELNFRLMKSRTKLKILKPLILSLKSLEHLTDLSLCLDNLRGNARPTILSLIGKSCPLLSKLKILDTDDVFKKEDILALFMGEVTADLIDKTDGEPEWLQDAQFGRLKVPSTLLSPICLTLRELKLHWYDSAIISDSLTDVEFVTSTAIFTLRHLQFLQKLSLPRNFTSMAVKDLHEQLRFQEKFEKDCVKALQERRSTLPPSLFVPQRNLNTTLSGTLSLTTLDSVNVLNRDMLRAVGSLCPSLKTATFVSESSYEGQVPEEGIVSPKELQTILKDWPKLMAVTIQNVKSEYVTPLLQVFGGELVSLDVSFSGEFNMLDLLGCSNLEILHVSSRDKNFSLMDSGEMSPSLSPVTFIPQLKEFRSDICLGAWSYLFENKSSLVQLSLNCCHIGMGKGREKGSMDHPRKRFKPSTEVSMNPSEWNRIPQMLPRVEVLKIEACAGLTTTMMASLVPQFYKLKEISLPYIFRSYDEVAVSYTVREQLSSRKPPIKLEFYHWDKFNNCPYVDEYEKEEGIL